MNILEVLSVQMPCTSGRRLYEVPLNDILLSHQMLEEGCPIQDETECPPLFQTRLISREVLDDFVKVWSRLDASVRRDGGKVVVRDTSGKAQLAGFRAQRRDAQHHRWSERSRLGRDSMSDISVQRRSLLHTRSFNGA